MQEGAYSNDIVSYTNFACVSTSARTRLSRDVRAVARLYRTRQFLHSVKREFKTICFAINQPMRKLRFTSTASRIICKTKTENKYFSFVFNLSFVATGFYCAPYIKQLTIQDVFLGTDVFFVCFSQRSPVIYLKSTTRLVWVSRCVRENYAAGRNKFR